MSAKSLTIIDNLNRKPKELKNIDLGGWCFKDAGTKKGMVFERIHRENAGQSQGGINVRDITKLTRLDTVNGFDVIKVEWDDNALVVFGHWNDGVLG